MPDQPQMQDDPKTYQWRRDILLVPLIVGVLVAVATFFIPKLFEKGKRISYTIDGPTAYINPKVGGAVKIIVDGVETSNIYGYRVRIWNSGSVSIPALPVLFAFATTTSNFKIFNTTHETVPAMEFGKIDEKDPDAFSRRYTYELLNPKDEDSLTFLCSHDALLSVFAKADGLRFEKLEAKTTDALFGKPMDKLIIMMIASTTFFTTMALYLVTLRNKRSLEKLRAYEEQMAKFSSATVKSKDALKDSF